MLNAPPTAEVAVENAPAAPEVASPKIEVTSLKTADTVERRREEGASEG